MKIVVIKSILVVFVAILSSRVSAFSPQTSRRAPPTTLAAQQQGDSSANKGLGTVVSGLALAGTIFASSFLLAPPEPTFAADYDISTGAIVINTSAKPGQSFLKAQVDVKDLLGSIFKNREGLKQSVERIANVVKEELRGPALSEIAREILQTERDVAPEIVVMPPNDYQQLARDLSSGRLNLIINGELINLLIDEKSTTDTDELVIRAKGIKGVKVVKPAQFIAKTRLQEQIEGFDEFWNGEFTLVKLPDSVGKVTNGLVFGGSTLSFVVAVYAASYAYYVQQQEQASKEAEEKRQATSKKKAAAAAKASATEEDEE